MKIFLLFFIVFYVNLFSNEKSSNTPKDIIKRFGVEYRLSLPEIHNIGLRFEITEQIYLTGFYGGFWYLNKKTNEFENQILNYSLEVTYYAKDFLRSKNTQSFISFQYTDYKSNGSAFIDESEFNYYILRVGYEFDLGKSFRLNFKYGISYLDFNGDLEEDNGNGVFSWEYIPKGFEYRSIGISVIYDF